MIIIRLLLILYILRLCEDSYFLFHYHSTLQYIALSAIPLQLLHLLILFTPEPSFHIHDDHH
jgi:hypothetical protein